MVQKRPFEVEEAHDISSKLPRQDPCDNLSLFPDISSFENANHVSGVSVKGGFTKGNPIYDEELPSAEKDIKRSPGREDDPDNSLSGSHSFSSGGTSGTSEEDVCMEAPFNTCFFPEYFYPEHPVTTLTRREVIYSLLLECPPQKQVPIGPLHQADIPQLNVVDLNQVDSLSAVEDGDEFEEPHAGTSIIPMPTAASLVEDVIKPVHGTADCSCLYRGSIRCVRHHVMEVRDKLKNLLGVQVFEELGFSDIGEQVAEKWTEEEESLFHEVVFSNPSSMGRNFWNCLSHAFPSRTKADIVSYYFNVFMLRKRAEQNRLDPMNVDSDNDEWQAIEEEDEDSVVESPFYESHPFDGSGDNYDELQLEKIADEACENDDDCSPHIGGVDNSRENRDFHSMQKTWNEANRSYHSTQDDSCTSFDIGDTMPATQVKYNGGICHDDVVISSHVAHLRSEHNIMPPFIKTGEALRKELANGQDIWEKGSG